MKRVTVAIVSIMVVALTTIASMNDSKASPDKPLSKAYRMAHPTIHGGSREGVRYNWFSQLDELDETVVFSEDFTGATAPDGWPEGWSSVLEGNDTNEWEVQTDWNLGFLDQPFAAFHPVYTGNDNEASLTTPVIDCSDYTEDLFLVFNYEFKVMYEGYPNAEEALIMISTDGGVTWPDTVFELVPDGALNNAYPQSVDITDEAGGESNVKVKFYYWSDGWSTDHYWAIDDVALIQDPAPFVSILESPLASFEDEDASFLVTATDAETISEIQVHFGEVIGDAVPNSSASDFTETGNPDEYEATISSAAYSAGQDIGWWIEVSDGGDPVDTRRIPAEDGSFFQFHVYPAEFDYAEHLDIDYTPFFDDISGTGELIDLGAAEWTTLAFTDGPEWASTFSWYGEEFNELFVSCNAWISFVEPSSPHPVMHEFPSDQPPHNVISLVGALMNPDTHGDVYFEEDVTSGRVTIQFDEVRLFAIGQTQNITAQLVFVRGTNSLFLNYQPLNNAAFTGSHSIGFENEAGEIGHSIEYGSEWDLFDTESRSILIGVNPSSLSGTVTNSESGDPLEGATISLTVDGEDEAREVLTDANGDYQILDIPPSAPGTYSLTANEAEHDAQTVAVTLTGGQNTVQDFSLDSTEAEMVTIDGYVWEYGQVNTTPINNAGIYVPLLGDTVYTDATGYFTFGERFPNTYTFRVFHNPTGSDDYHNRRYHNVVVDADTTFDFEMYPILPPNDLTGIGGDNRVALTWSPPTNDQQVAVHGYYVRADGVLQDSTTSADDTTLTIGGLENFQAYEFDVAARYVSPWSGSLYQPVYREYCDTLAVFPVPDGRYETDVLTDFEWVEINPDSTDERAGTATGFSDDTFLSVNISSLPFWFNAVDRNSMVVMANGLISFTSNGAFPFPEEIPNTTTPDNFIAPFWQDLNPNGTGEDIWYWISPDDSLIVIETLSGLHGGGAEQFEFQIVLDATDSTITTNYRSANQGWNLGDATVGVEWGTGIDTRGVVFPQEDLEDSLSILYSWYDREFGNLRGRVTDGENPVVGAEVFVSYDRYDVRDTTDAQGYFHLLGVDRSDTFDVVARTDIHAPAVHEVVPGDWTENEFTLDVGDVELVDAGAAPGAFDLLTPEEGEILYHRQPTLSWSESTDPDEYDVLNYTVQWARDADFSVNLTTVTTRNHSLFLANMSNTFTWGDTVYWRVKAYDLTGQETWSTNGGENGIYFVLESPDPPAPFDLTSPVDGATVGSLVTFSWTHAVESDPGDSVVYFLELSYEEQPFTPAFTYSTGTAVTYSTTGIPDSTTMWWRIRAEDTNTPAIYSNQTWSFVRPVYSDSIELAGQTGNTNGWHLFSIPAIPFVGQDDTSTILGDDIVGAYSVFEGTPPHPLVGTLENGIGYWLYLENTSTIDMVGRRRLQTFSDSLANGWNTIGAAMAYNYPVDSLRFTDGADTLTWRNAVASNWIIASSIGYNPFNSSWSIVDSLEPWNGYSLFVLPDTSHTLSVITTPLDPELVYGQSLAINEQGKAKEKVKPDKKGKKATQGELDSEAHWFIPVIMTYEEAIDSLAGFGVHPSATDGFDAQFDMPAPPDIDSQGDTLTNPIVRVQFEQQDWEEEYGTAWYARDVRYSPEIGTETIEWSGRLYGDNVQGEIQLDFSVTQDSLPDGYHLEVDLDGEVFDLSINPVISFTMTQDTHPFTIYAINRFEERRNSLPVTYAVEAIYPNPFNPMTTIQVGLPQAHELTIEVFNVLGQRVGKIANGRFEAGRHRFLFNAENLASGMYFVHVTAPGKLDVVRKLVLAR